MLYGDEFQIDGLDYTGSSGYQTTCHEEAETDFDFLGDLEIPEEEDGIDGEDDVGEGSPACTYISESPARGIGIRTALEVCDMIRPLDMIACPRNHKIPKLMDGRALQQYHDSLVYVDDDIADRDEPEQIYEHLVLVAVGSILYP